MSDSSKRQKTGADPPAERPADDETPSTPPASTIPPLTTPLPDDDTAQPQHAETTHKNMIMVLDVSTIKAPKHVVRVTRNDRKSLLPFIAMFKNKQYGITRSFISATIPGLPSTSLKSLLDLFKEVPEEERTMKLVREKDPNLADEIEKQGFTFVDGMHRAATFQLPEVQQVVGLEQKVELMYREDFEPMEELEMVSLGTVNNQVDAAKVKFTLSDRIHATLSTLHSVQDTDQFTIASYYADEEDRKLAIALKEQANRVNPTTLNNFIRRRNMNQDVEEDQSRRYCSIAVGVHRHLEKKTEILQAINSSNLDIKTLANSLLWESPDSGSVLFTITGLNTLKKGMEKHKKGNKKGKGGTKRYRDSDTTSKATFNRVRAFYEQLVRLAERKKITPEVMLEVVFVDDNYPDLESSISKEVFKWMERYSHHFVADTEVKNFSRIQGDVLEYIENNAKWSTVGAGGTDEESQVADNQNEASVNVADPSSTPNPPDTTETVTEEQHDISTPAPEPDEPETNPDEEQPTKPLPNPGEPEEEATNTSPAQTNTGNDDETPSALNEPAPGSETVTEKSGSSQTTVPPHPPVAPDPPQGQNQAPTKQPFLRPLRPLLILLQGNKIHKR